MSYIPDFRNEENEKYLTETEKAFLRGYSFAVEDAKNAASAVSEAFLEKDVDEFFEEFTTFIECSEIEAYCGIYESADIPEDVELIDDNEPLYYSLRKEMRLD